MSDWDAAQYHRVSDPQRAWGLSVLERLAPRSGERILDLGCGTGRLTADLCHRTPLARVAAADLSATMVGEARRHLPAGVAVIRADALALPFAPNGFDAVFSTATFHWVPDHPRLFAELHRVLRSGGRLVAQAGGGRNLERLYSRASALAGEPAYAGYFAGWRDPWTFAGEHDTRERLAHAGFSAVRVWLESTPTSLDGAAAYREFVTTVCLRHQLQRLPEQKRAGYVTRLVELAAADDPAFTLDYWRLNIDGRKH